MSVGPAPAALALALLLACHHVADRATVTRRHAAPIATCGPPASAAPSPLLVALWCGPPLDQFDDARAAEIAAAGFTAVGPPCEGARSTDLNRRALDVAARHGLHVWIADHRFGIKALETTEWRTHLREAVSDYQHPALGAYFVTDEPIVGDFSVVAALVAELRAAAPDRLAYVNLLPDYVPPEAVTDYPSYVRQFIASVRPALLSYDYYPFRLNGDRPSYFANLALIRDSARSHDLPFLAIIQAMPHGQYRDPSEGELAWQVFHALAYGARGISYFAYWTPVDVEGADRWRFRHGLVEHGRPTAHYFQAARLNRAASQIAAQLASYRSAGVADSDGVVAPHLPIGPIESISGGPVTVGWFRGDGGATAAIVVNQDHGAAVTIQLRSRPGAGAPQVFDPRSGCWQAADVDAFSLAAGSGRLLRW